MERIQEFTRNHGIKDIHARWTLFLIGCIGLRALFTYLAKTINKDYLQWAALPALALAIGWIAIFLFDLRRTGGEVFGQDIWWNHMRPIHAGLYLAFALMAFKQHDLAYLPLLLDTVIGLGAFLHFHFL